MVANQSMVQEHQNDMYCSPAHSSYAGEYYPDSHYYIHGGSPELCPAHTAIQTIHGDYGPVTVPMVSTNSSPPIAMPVQVPPGHVVQQIVDENGTLRHVILSPQHPPGGLVPLPSHNQQQFGNGPSSNSQTPQTYFPQGLPPGFAPPHFHSNLTHAPSAQPAHSPPPSHGYYKDERAQRQYVKLRKKLQDKQLKLDPLAQNSALPARKDNVNGLRRTSVKDKGMNSVGTSEDGEEGSSLQDEEEDELHIITNILSSVQPPRVSELTSRSALLQWGPPLRFLEASNNDGIELDISESDIRYEVLLSDKSKEMKYRAIYTGVSLSCRIQDLRPGQEYSVCLQAHLDEMQGTATDPVKFTTPICEPDPPQPPKLISRTKNSLQLRWNATTDNGSHISYYILEFDDGNGGEFVELCRSRGKQHTLQKLQPATLYKFRMAATNEVGKSLYSDVVSFATSDHAPLQPSPPHLKQATITSLHLIWERRPKDDQFVLQMNDPKTRYGYLVAYNGRDAGYVCENLKYYTDYTFRLKVQNDGGSSPWSDEVTFQTLPDRPARPSKPLVKGRINAHSFKLKWEPPAETGGAEIEKYILELNSGSGYQTVYTGRETEALCDKLTPGTTYQMRVSCVTEGGPSNYSDPCTVTTDAIAPGQCGALQTHGKPKSDYICVHWTEPDYNGGAPILEYEVEMMSPDSSRRQVHKSKERECGVANLSPGCEYVFNVRAVNRVGTGPWSDTLVATSGAAPPGVPLPPTITCKSPFHIYLEWDEPVSNGAPITDYRLEMSSTDAESQFLTAYQGPAANCDVKGLTPFTPYYFRTQAANRAGFGGFSSTVATMTPAAPPSTISVLHGERTPTSVSLKWSEPLNNGAAIIGYNIEVADRMVSTDGPRTECTIEDLQPNTSYKIKVQAANSVGVGAFSSSLKITTLSLPPAAPHLECIGAAHNYLKLKWGEGKNTDFTQYVLEMENNRTREYQCVHQGSTFTYKVNKLQELTTYRFRIYASNDIAGTGDYSREYSFTTGMAPPTGVKTLRVVAVEQTACSLEWNPIKTCVDPITYVVQMCHGKEQEYKQIYKGSETKCTADNLEPGTNYSVRVCPVRLTASSELPGSYSPACTFSTLQPETTGTAKSSAVSAPSAHQTKNRSFFQIVRPHLTCARSMSEQQLVLLGTVLLVVIGIVISMLIVWILKLN